MKFEVTNVRLKPVRDDNEVLRAFASVIFEEQFVVHNIRLIETDEKLIAAMPNEEYGNGYRDITHPITNQCRGRITIALIEAYNNHPETRDTLPLEKKSTSEPRH